MSSLFEADALYRPAPGLVRSAWRYRWSSLAVVVAALALGLLYSVTQTPTYTASARIALSDPRGPVVLHADTTSGMSDMTRFANQRAAYANSDDVLLTAGRQLRPAAAGSDAALRDWIRSRVHVSVDTSSLIVTVTATASKKGMASDIADQVVSVYVAKTKQSVLAAQRTAELEIASRRDRINDALALVTLTKTPAAVARVADLTDQLKDLGLQANQLGVAAAEFGAGTEFTDPATREFESPRFNKTIVGGLFLLGIAIAFLQAWVRADRNIQVSDSSGASSLLNTPLLVNVPRQRGSEARSVAASLDAYSMASAALRARFSAGALVITGTGRSDGTTPSAARLARALAAGGSRVLLVDGDPRSRDLTMHLGLPLSTRGIIDVLTNRASIDDVLVTRTMGRDRALHVMPAGSGDSDSSALLESRSMSELMVELKSRFDIIIVDTAPLLESSEAASLVSVADATLAVVRAGRSETEVVALRQRIELLGSPLVGCIFTLDDGRHMRADDVVSTTPRQREDAR